ncbi:MAG: L,D-transpeptidase, partial [Geodermatophilaceae bacterium]
RVLILGLVLVLTGCTGEGGFAGQQDGRTSAAPRPALLQVLPADGQVDISPASAILVSLSYGELDSVTVENAAGLPVAGAMASPDGSRSPLWQPSEPLSYGESYTITAQATGEDGKQVSSTSTFSTVTPTAQVFPSIGPLDGTTVGVGMPIRVYFDQPVTDKAAAERNLVVSTSTEVVGGWNWFSDTEVHWRPQVYWPANTEVRLDANLYGVSLGAGAWGQLDRSIAFTIGASHVSVADAATYTMQVYSDGALVQTFPVSMGSPEFQTRSGPHVVIDQERNKIMDSTTYGLALDAGGYLTAVEYATRISNNGEFVHAAPWSVAQQGISNVSHGCINLAPERAAWFFEFSQIGDVVEVINGGPMLSAVDGDIYDWAIPWETWLQGSALA